MYAMLEREAREAGLPLHWPGPLPNTRRALAAAEWVRRNRPAASPSLHRALKERGDPRIDLQVLRPACIRK